MKNKTRIEQRLKGKRIALMLPCLNEELTLAKVIRDFRSELPSLEIYVFDNNSTDRSVEIALQEGAKVIPVPRKGKGNVVRKMFEVVEADYYLMVDSDDTYDASGVFDLLAPLLDESADMVVGSRLSFHTTNAFRKFHRIGNRMILGLINLIFKSRLTDILSGYRAMTRGFVKSIPLMRAGFEVETELTVYALINEFQIKEIPLSYRHRPPNSHSKLRTLSDGYKVILTIVWLARDLRPLLFFWLIALALLVCGLVPSLVFLPNQIFLQNAMAMLIVGLGMTGLVLNTLHVRFQEMQLLARRNSTPAGLPRMIGERAELTRRAENAIPIRDTRLGH